MIFEIRGSVVPTDDSRYRHFNRRHDSSDRRQSRSRAVILFGSRERGDECQDSDVDPVVVEAVTFGPKRSRRKETVRLYHAAAGFPVAADVLVYSRDDVDYWRDSLNHVLARALREGKVLYERR